MASCPYPQAFSYICNVQQLNWRQQQFGIRTLKTTAQTTAAARFDAINNIKVMKDSKRKFQLWAEQINALAAPFRQYELAEQERRASNSDSRNWLYKNIHMHLNKADLFFLFDRMAITHQQRRYNKIRPLCDIWELVIESAELITELRTEYQNACWEWDWRLMELVPDFRVRE